jgi:hypothetical protein
MTRRTPDTNDYEAPLAFTEQTVLVLAERVMDIMTDPMPPLDHDDRYWWRMEVARLTFGATDADMIRVFTGVCLSHGLPDDFREGLVDEWLAYTEERRGY